MKENCCPASGDHIWPGPRGVSWFPPRFHSSPQQSSLPLGFPHSQVCMFIRSPTRESSMRHKHFEFVLTQGLACGSPTSALDYVLIKVREAEMANCRRIPDIGQSESPRAGFYTLHWTAGSQGMGRGETLFGDWGGLLVIELRCHHQKESQHSGTTGLGRTVTSPLWTRKAVVLMNIHWLMAGRLRGSH